MLQRYPATATVFLVNNELPAVGHTLVQADLAKTLRRIARQGRAGFYQGKTASNLVNGVSAAGGIWSNTDLANYHIIERHPIITHYHDLRIVSAPPPSSGGIVLAQMLNILEHFNLKKLDPVIRKHVIVESMRRAYRDRAAYLGDPDFVKIEIDRLLNQEYLEGLSLSIDLTRATPSDEIGIPDTPDQLKGEDTTHFSILDSEGNRVSATLSINLPFGSGFMPPGTGVLLNNEMDDFSSRAHVPNAYGLIGDEANSIAPGKRPLSSMTPTFVESTDRVGILGTPGGSRIITMVLLGILELAEQKPPRNWVSAPRFHHQYVPDEIQFEQGALTATEQLGLQRLGHKLVEKSRKYGDMQAILWYKPRQIILTASDPRGEGQATVITLGK